MKKKIFLSLILLPLIILSFFAHKTISGVIYYEKEFYFIALVSLFIIIHLFSIKKWSINVIDIILFIFTGYILLANYREISLGFSLVKVIYLFGFYLIFKEFLIGGRIQLKTTYIILMVCFFLYSFQGFLQYYDFLPHTSSLNKVSGHYSNPAPFSALLIALIAFPFSKLLSKKKHITGTNSFNNIIDYILFVLILIGVITIIFTKSRAALVAMTICFLLIFVLERDVFSTVRTKLNMSIKKISLVLTIAIMPLVILLYSLRPDSAYGRLVIWKISLQEMFKEKIVFGHGLDAFQNHYMRYQAQYFKNNLSSNDEIFSVANTPYSFNEFIKILIEQGSIGFIIFISLLVCLFYYGFQSYRKAEVSAIKELLLASLAALSSVVVFSSFSYPFHDITFQVIFFVLIAIISSQIPSFKDFKVKPLFSLTTGIIISAIVILSFQKQYNTYNAFNLWRANTSFNKDYNELEKIKYFFKNQGLFYIDLADALYENDNREDAIKVLEEGKNHTSNPTLYMKLGRYYDEGFNDVREAESSYMQASFSIPYKFYPKYRLLKMYERNNLEEKAYLIAKEIIEMPIKIDSEALQRMKNHAEKVIQDYSQRGSM